MPRIADWLYPHLQVDQLVNPGESKADLRIEKERRRKANKKKKANKKYAKGEASAVPQEDGDGVA